MNFLTDSFLSALLLIWTLDHNLLEIVGVSLKVGSISTYHDAKANQVLDVITQLSGGDVIGFSLYPQALTFSPVVVHQLMAEISQLAGSLSVPFAITETSWSTRSFAGSQSNQSIYVNELFSIYQNYQNSSMEFLGMPGTFDYAESQLGLSTPEVLAGVDQISEWLLSLFLVHNNGNPKSAGAVFLDNMRSLN